MCNQKELNYLNSNQILNTMKKINLVLILISISLFVLLSCEKEEKNINFTLDTPNEFVVSKGDFADKIVLDWNNPPKSEKIEVFRFDSITNAYKSIGFSETSSYTDNMDFIPNAYYYYKIRAHNSSEEISGLSNYDYGYVSDYKYPTITNIGYGVSESAINISWNTVNGSEFYKVFRSNNKEEYTEIGTAEATSYSDSESLIPGKTYYYKVKAYNAELGYSGFSQPDSGYILESYSYLTSFGDFYYGYGIEFDNENKIYVGDNYSGDIKVYNSDYSFDKNLIATGKSLRGLGWSIDNDLLAVNSADGKLLKVDHSGSITAEFNVSNSFMLREAITDENGNFYITDVTNNDIVKLNSSGELVKKWKMKQVSPASSFYTSGIEIQNNRIFVSGVNASNFVEIYDFDGNFINQWAFPYAAAYISKDIDGNLYFACFNSKVIKTDAHGKILAFIGNDKLQRCESVNVNSLGIVFASDEKQPTQIHVFSRN